MSLSMKKMHGIHAVTAAIKHDQASIKNLWADTKSRNKRLLQILSYAKKVGLSIHHAESKQLDQLAATDKHQGIVAECVSSQRYQEADLDQLLTDLEQTALLLVLDGVTDPHNLGACLRTAEAAGVQAVITTKDKAAGLTPVVRKVASGAAEIIPLIQVTNLARTLDTLKDAGIWIIGTSDHATENMYSQDLTGPIAFVMGAEGKGMRRLTEKQCDILANLPMAGEVSSLNISVATGVCLYEAVRQRQCK
jgi:23S rRNA (guanosine2251-2'-O)-methyltransferase